MKKALGDDALKLEKSFWAAAKRAAKEQPAKACRK